MELNAIYKKAIDGLNLSVQEGIKMYTESSPQDLFALANQIRYINNPLQRVSWQIDRNINYTNVCISGCLFCNFHCKISDKGAIRETSIAEYEDKIKELFEKGGNQLLLQGGLHPNYDIYYYEKLFKTLKTINPLLKLNALGPPEIAHIAKISRISIDETIQRLIAAGLNSLPGAGAEILSDRVRSVISPAKPTSDVWVSVMKRAHYFGLGSSATMVYGHIETLQERVEHLVTIRDIQSQKPESSPGFRAFIGWPMQISGTKLEQICSAKSVSPIEHLKMVALARIILNNIPHIQASWLTIGKPLAQLSLHCGADDMGSIMIEENVVSSAGVNNRMDRTEIQKSIIEAGFEPWLRNQDYTPYLPVS